MRFRNPNRWLGDVSKEWAPALNHRNQIDSVWRKQRKMLLVETVTLTSIRFDEHGVARIADSRVTLEVLIAAYKSGDSPETIAQNYDSLSLADVYSAIAYYLKNREEVDRYLAELDQESDTIRRRDEQRYGNADLGERLRLRQKSSHNP